MQNAYKNFTAYFKHLHDDEFQNSITVWHIYSSRSNSLSISIATHFFCQYTCMGMLLYNVYLLNAWSRDSSVGIVTGYGMDDRGCRSSSPGRVKNFPFSTSCRPALGRTQPPIQWVPRAISPEVKRRGREADHSPPTSSEVKKTWIYTCTLPYVFLA
jgi:hypothetical protein